jgi:transcriptional regulator with XRE-family HTH domain
MSDLVAEVIDRRLPPPMLCRAIRREAGVTQDRVASELGVNRVSVARWEGGSRRPRGEVRGRYAQLLRDLQTAVSDR